MLDHTETLLVFYSVSEKQTVMKISMPRDNHSYQNHQYRHGSEVLQNSLLFSLNEQTDWKSVLKHVQQIKKMAMKCFSSWLAMGQWAEQAMMT